MLERREPFFIRCVAPLASGAGVAPVTLTADRRALLPSSALPIAYFGAAHAALATALVGLILRPGLPGAFFFHPRMVAVVHLVTLGWIASSILGSFYIVAPLALRMSLPVRRGDWIAFGGFVLGVAGMVAHFWMGDYDGMAWAGLLVVATIAWVATRAVRALPRAALPWPVALHVGLAFANVLLTGFLGVLIGFDRSRGFLGVPPMSAAFAHAHLAAVGFALMMVIGLGYRLIPMMLPAAMPAGARLAVSAVLLEGGLMAVVWGLCRTSPWLTAGAALIAAGFASFALVLRGTLAHRVPRPPALPARDWSTWQTHGALLWLGVAMVLGLTLTVLPAGPTSIMLAWAYGVAGLLGFLAQIIVGMQGRLVPLYAYYRAMAARDGEPPARAANQLPSPSFARGLFACWSVGVPLLAAGLASSRAGLIVSGAACVLAGTLLNAAYLHHLLRAARAAR
jgi:hypothetical protein